MPTPQDGLVASIDALANLTQLNDGDWEVRKAQVRIELLRETRHDGGCDATQANQYKWHGVLNALRAIANGATQCPDMVAALTLQLLEM